MSYRSCSKKLFFLSLGFLGFSLHGQQGSYHRNPIQNLADALTHIKDQSYLQKNKIDLPSLSSFNEDEKKELQRILKVNFLTTGLRELYKNNKVFFDSFFKEIKSYDRNSMKKSYWFLKDAIDKGVLEESSKKEFLKLVILDLEGLSFEELSKVIKDIEDSVSELELSDEDLARFSVNYLFYKLVSHPSKSQRKSFLEDIRMFNKSRLKKVENKAPLEDKSKVGFMNFLGERLAKRRAALEN